MDETTKLRSINTITVQKSLVQKDKKLILEHLSHEVDDLAAEMKQKLEELSTAFEDKAAILMNKVRELKQASADQRAKLQKEIKELRASLKETWDEWVALTRQATQQYQLAHTH